MSRAATPVLVAVREGLVRNCKRARNNNYYIFISSLLGMSASQQCLPCSNPKCGQPMSNDYLCIGCCKPVHWFCAAGSEEVKMSKGHGMHYWCPPCYSKLKQVLGSEVSLPRVPEHFPMTGTGTDTMDDLDVSRLATRARNDDDIAELNEVIPLLFQRRNDGNDEQNDKAEEEFDQSGNDPWNGNAEDQSDKMDDHNNQPTSEQVEVDPSSLKFPPTAGNKSTTSKQHVHGRGRKT